MNNLNYKEAIKKDKRTFCQYYLSLIRIKHLIVFTFYPKKDYNPKVIKLISFLTLFSLYFTVKTLFFNDSIFHVIYLNKGIYDLIFQLPQIVYSSLISGVIGTVLSILSKTQSNILEYKKLKDDINNKKKRFQKLIFNIKIKLIFFFIVNYILIFSFWFYISSFCAVYKNTQIYLIKDVLISFSLSFIYPFLINIFPSIFRIYSLNNKKKSSNCLYSFSIN